MPPFDLAREMNMSPAHFQRLFSQWVGVSPKRYQQYLAMGHAKSLLRARFTTLATADAVGLSGSGRLHDMFLTWEAMSPGDFAAGETGDAAAMKDLTSRWPKATYVEDTARLQPWVQAALGQSQETAPLYLIGAPFQLKVWEALLNVPTGHVTTYSEIAGAIGTPKAVRAVGTAVGRNPISWLIPCHRALRKSGALGGYHWGLERKRAMLAWEAARAEAS